MRGLVEVLWGELRDWFRRRREGRREARGPMA